MILDVLKDFDHIFEPIYWKKVQASGNINDQVRAGIASCDFGICYFSEPVKDDASGGQSYADNPNVLFEAGMMQMLHELRDRRDALTLRWIPIREEHKEAPPFNFAGDRILIVPRIGETSELNEEGFKKQLHASVQELVDQLDLD